MNEAVPTHLGLIIDGNRRWAAENGLSPIEGHRKGYANLKTICIEAIEAGVSVVSAYVFSTENWNRPKDEVTHLMDLAIWVFKNELKEFEKEEIKVVFLGAKERLSAKLQKMIETAEKRTKHFTRGTLALCFNYGGQDEIVDSLKSIIDRGQTSDSINHQTIADNLYHPEIPAVDLVIRTSGEQRLSNFMLWRVAYAELIFCSELWPDYNKDSLRRDLGEYKKRKRRFGV